MEGVWPWCNIALLCYHILYTAASKSQFAYDYALLLQKIKEYDPASMQDKTLVFVTIAIPTIINVS